MQRPKPQLSDRLREEIISIAKANGVRKVILFGSRARGDNWKKSDVDLAVSGGSVVDFRLDVDEKTRTLLSFDVVNLDREISAELSRNIDRDGVVLYEQQI